MASLPLFWLIVFVLAGGVLAALVCHWCGNPGEAPEDGSATHL
jgi:hypothetical protein